MCSSDCDSDIFGHMKEGQGREEEALWVSDSHGSFASFASGALYGKGFVVDEAREQSVPEEFKEWSRQWAKEVRGLKIADSKMKDRDQWLRPIFLAQLDR
jgi:hypothetical protein